ncbi:MAG TPA: sarcosine oxidase subunit gamma family protein [Bauldia sp.]|nr:sarcosine oxidase subunit gamma family protein [Bauldia sp.]
MTATVTMLPDASRYILRGDPSAFSGYGVRLPTEACRAATNGVLSALWLGPDEWLLLLPEGQALPLDAMASVVDVSDRQVAIEVRGEYAAEALNAFNALDLHIDAFPVGMCTRTLFGKAEIVLWRTALETFRIEVWRSFAPYVLGCLAEATREYA